MTSQIEKGLEAAELARLREFAEWVDTWVSNPVGAYSVMALDGLFVATRDRLAALTATGESAGPQGIHHEAGGFVEFINSDVPYIVREIDGKVAILLDMTTRDVIGYRVYDPATGESKTESSPEVTEAMLRAFHDELSRHIVHGEDAYRAALTAALSVGREGAAQGRAVRVKPLEWKPGGGDGVRSLRADAIGLRYYIFQNGDDGLWRAYTEGYMMERFGEHQTKEAAKTAVQIGHATRILAALDTSPEGMVEERI